MSVIRTEIPRISILDYSGREASGGRPARKPPDRFFDSASIGRCCLEAEREVVLAESNEKRDWDALRDEVRVKYATLLNASIEHVELYYNTTAAIQRVFQVALAHSSSYAGPLLTTDEEYPGIAALVDEAWPGSVFIARISKAISTGRGETVGPILLDACKLIRPSVIYLSHVMRYSGYCISASTIRELRQLSPRALIIIDGAQAVGNVLIASEILQDSDFYITSGHKWLGGEPTLGLVYASRWAKLIADPAQSYSRKSGSGGTGSLRALVSISKALDEFLLVGGESSDWNPTQRMQVIADHNRSLAELFMRELTTQVDRRGRRPYPILFGYRRERHREFRTGIVVVARMPPSVVDALGSREESDFEFTALQAELLRDGAEGIVPAGRRYLVAFPEQANSVPRIESLKLPETRWPHYAQHDGICLRFCFHHYHSSADVVALANSLAEHKQINAALEKGRRPGKREAKID